MAFKIHIQTDFRFEILDENNEVVPQHSSASAPISQHTWLYITCPTDSEEESHISPVGSIETSGWIIHPEVPAPPTQSRIIHPEAPVDLSWDIPPPTRSIILHPETPVDLSWDIPPPTQTRIIHPEAPADLSWDIPPPEVPSSTLAHNGEWDLPKIFGKESEEEEEEETEEDLEEETEEDLEEETDEEKYF